MLEQHPVVNRVWRPAAALLAAGALAAVAGCGSQSGENPGPSTTPGISHSASPFPSANKAPAGMADSDDPQLQILADYETALHHEFDNEMYFTDMPRTVEEAESQAEDMAHTLKEYSKYGIKPVIIMEPTNNDGNNISLSKLHHHGYGHVLGALFKGLKERGVTDEEMGTLFPMPEADLPNWGAKPHSTDPNLFGKNYTAVGNAYRKVFPNGKLGLLLDSTAYPTGDVNYEHGDTAVNSLMPYIEALKSPDAPKVDALMYQGFPWVAGSVPSEWLNGKVAVALASKLGARTIWFNTGTAGFIDGHKVSDGVRGSLLRGELQQAQAAKAAGFVVKINVFGGEDHDPTVLWGYPLRHSEAAGLLRSFVQSASAAGIDTALYADQR